MRICIVIEVYVFGGPDVVITEMIESWPDPGDEFIIVANRYSQRFRQNYTQRLHRPVQWVKSPSLDRGEMRHRLVSTPWFWPGLILLYLMQYPLLLWNAARLAMLFRKLQPDALLINNGGYPAGDTCRAAVLAAARAGIPKVFMAIHSLAMAPQLWRWLPERLLDRYIDRHAQVVCVSQAALARFRDVRAFRQPTVVIHNGFTPRHASCRSREDVLKEFGLPPGSYLISMIGSWDDPQKGHDLIIRAVGEMRQSCPHLRLVVFGTGKQAQEMRLRRVIAQHHLEDAVVLCGFRGDVTSYVRVTDLLVQPSVRFESLPMAIIEAMALRVPVIASDLGGVPELIEDGVTGRLLPPGDISALIGAIEQAIEQPELARQWAENAYQRYQAYHTGEAMARSYHLLLTGDS